jgi:hypothetical protein
MGSSATPLFYSLCAMSAPPRPLSATKRTLVHGRAGIAAVLAQLIARRTEIEIDRVVVRRVTMRSDGLEGARFTQSYDATMAIHRVEGTWKLAVIAPWGDR